MTTAVNPLVKLASLAPKKDEKPKHKTRKSQGKSDLGPVDIGNYLSHYNYQYKIKSGPHGEEMFILEQCLFDPNHGRGEARISVLRDGKITYNCFHQSCNHGWPEVRTLISGDKKLTQFQEGYDPNWRPLERKDNKAFRQMEGEKPFLAVNDKDRVKFNCAKMADFLEEKFKPFLYEGKSFGGCCYRYHNGVWQVYPEDGIRKVARVELGDHAKPKWIWDAVQTLKDQAYRPWEGFDFDPMWLNLQNGMLHVETMELVPHAPEFYSRVQLPVMYRDDATCPRWIEAVMEIFEDDPEKGQVLQEFFGYCLYPKILFPAALFQIGQGRNGKGVVERVLCSMLGQANVSHISLARMEDRFGPAELRNRLLNSTGETETKPLDVTTFKAAVAGDEIQAEVKYEPDIKFRPIAKHMVSMNAFPGLKEKTDAFFRRIIVLEYNQQFEGNKEDKRLADKLIEELDGIFKWALDGLKRVLENEEICTPATVARAKKRFKAKNNPVLMFVEEMCVLDVEAKQGGIRVLPPKLFNEYQEWMEEAKLKALGKQNFYEQIYLNYPQVDKKRDSKGTKEYFYGMGLAVNPKGLDM